MNSKYIELKPGEIINVMALTRVTKTKGGSGLVIKMIGVPESETFYFKTIEERDNHYQMIMDILQDNDAYLGDFEDWQEQYNQ